MPRLALINMAIGFFVLFFAAAAGAFIASDITAGYVKDPAILETWRLLLQRSSHGHTNLFALIHIGFGLTMPYSRLSGRIKLWQTLGLGAGTFAMGPLMLGRAYAGPAASVDVLDVVLGGLLSASLVALLSHSVGLLMAITRSR